MLNREVDNVRNSGETKSPEVKARSILGRSVSYAARRLIDRPRLGGRRRRRRGLDVDIPTGGVPGTRIPTGSRLDPDKDGWSDEGTTKPIWVGLPKAKLPQPPKINKNRDSYNATTPVDRLASGAKKPSWPRKPTYGAFVDGAIDYFSGARNWKEFSELYKDREIIWLDYETTGLIFDDFKKPSHNGNPTQLGLVKVKNGKVVEKLNLFMNPQMKLEPWSRDNLKDADGNPITDEWLSTQMSIEDAHKKLVEFAGDKSILGVQNASFDKDVLEDALESSGISWRPYGYIDTKEISDMVLPKWNEETQDGPYKIIDGNKVPSNGLADITKYLGIDLGSKHHYATEDARAASEVMQAIIDKAIENNWSTDIFDKKIRDAKLLADKKAYTEKIEKFKIDKENWLKNNSNENTRISSGLDKNKIFKISAEEVEKIEQHRRRKYKYGDESVLHDGKQIRRDRQDWLEGLTPEQMAEVLVPSSNEEFFEMWLDDFAPGARLEPKIVEAFKKYWNNHMENNPWDVIDESPESVQAMKDVLKASLESNPYMRWAYEKHGAPMHAVWARGGIDSWESRKEMQELLDKITEQRNYRERAHVSGRLSPFIELVVFHPKTIIEMSGNEGEKIPLSLGQNHEVIPGDSHIDNSIAGRMMHEWAHWLHWRAIRDQGKLGESKNRIYYGSGNINDPEYMNALSIAEQYRSHSMNPNLIKLHEDGVDINKDPNAPRTTTSYSHISPAEMIAEGISAILHPNRNIQNDALNDKLRKDAKILLGGDGFDDEPWELHASKEIAIRKKKIDSLTKRERKNRLSSGKLDAIGRENYKNSFLKKYSPKSNFKKYTSGTSPNNLIFSREIEKDKFDINNSDSAKFSYVDELGRTIEVFNNENPNKFASELFFSKNISDSLNFEYYDFFELFTEKEFPNTKRFKKLQDELNESSKFLVRVDKLDGSEDLESVGFSPIDNIVTDSSMSNEHAYLNLKPIKTENAGFLFDTEAEGLFESSLNGEKSYFLKFDAESENGLNVLKTVLINSLLKEWNKSSNSPISKMINAAASELFDGETQKYKNQRQMDFIRDFASTIYEKTQDYFRGKGITHIGLYRSLNISDDIEKQIKESMLDIDGNKKMFLGVVDGNQLSSWSNNIDSTLAPIKRSVGKSAILKSIVKSDDVFSMHLFGMGSSDNEEFILKNNKRPSILRLIENDEMDNSSLSKISKSLQKYDESSFFSNINTYAKITKEKDEETFRYLVNFLNNDDESSSRLSSGGSSRAKIALDTAFKKIIKKFRNVKYTKTKQNEGSGIDPSTGQVSEIDFIIPTQQRFDPSYGVDLSEALKAGGYSSISVLKYMEGDNFDPQKNIIETEIDSTIIGPESSLAMVYEVVGDASRLDLRRNERGEPTISVQSAAKRAVAAGIAEHMDESAKEISSLLLKRGDVIDLFPEKYRDQLRKLFKIFETEKEFFESTTEETDEGAETIFGVEKDEVGTPDTSSSALLAELIEITKPGVEQNRPESDYEFLIDPSTGQVLERNANRAYDSLKNTLVARSKLIKGFSSIIGQGDGVDRKKIISLFPQLKEGVEFWNQIKDDLTNGSGWKNGQFSRADIAQILLERLIDDAFNINSPESGQTVGKAFLPDHQRQRFVSILRDIGGLTEQELFMLGYGRAIFGETNAEFDASAYLIFESIRSARVVPKDAQSGFGRYSIQYGILSDSKDTKENLKDFQTIFELSPSSSQPENDRLPAPDIKDVDLIIAAEQDSIRDFGGDELMPRGSVRNEPNKYTGKTYVLENQLNKRTLQVRRREHQTAILEPLFGKEGGQLEDVKIDVYEHIDGKIHYFFRKASDPLRPPSGEMVEQLGQSSYEIKKRENQYPNGLIKTVDLRLSGLNMDSAATVIDRFLTEEHLRERIELINEKIKAAVKQYGNLAVPGEISDMNGSIFPNAKMDSELESSLRRNLDSAKMLVYSFAFNERYDARTEEGQKALKRTILSKLIQAWAGSSNKVLLSTLSQELAREIFSINGATSLEDMLTEATAPKGTVVGVLREVYQNGEQLEIPDGVKSVLTSVLKAMHENTQQYFREKGISHITIYRGMSLPNRLLPFKKFSTQEEIRATGGIAEESQLVSVSMRPLSSWSTSFDLASRFGGDIFENSSGDNGRTGVVLASTVPVEDILAIPLTGFGCLMEHEVVLLGRQREAIINKNSTLSKYPKEKLNFFKKIDSDFVQPLREKEMELMSGEERLSSGAEFMNSKLEKNINSKEILDMSKNITMEFEDSEKTNIFNNPQNAYRLGLGVDSEINEGIVIPRNQKGLQLKNIDLFDENGEPTESLIDDFLGWAILNGENEFLYGKTNDSDAALNTSITDDDIHFDVVDVYPETKEFIDRAKFLAFGEKQTNAMVLSKLRQIDNQGNIPSDSFLNSGATGAKNITQSTIRKFNENRNKFIQNLNTTGSPKLRQIGNIRRVELQKHKNVKRVRFESSPNNFEDYFIFDSNDGLSVSVFSGEQLKKYINNSTSNRPSVNQLNQMTKKEKPVAKLQVDKNKTDFLSMFNLSIDESHRNRGIADAMIRVQHEFNANDISKYAERLSSGTNSNKKKERKTVKIGTPGFNNKIITLTYKVYDSESDWINEKYPRPNKKQIQKIKEAGDRIIKSRLDAVWFTFQQPNGEKINSPLLTYSGRLMMIVNVNGVRVPFYRSSGKNPKEGVVPGQWYPFFGINTKGQWFNKFDRMSTYYDIPELREVAKILDLTVGNDLPNPEKFRWNAADRKIKPGLRRNPKGDGFIETDTNIEKPGLKRAIAEEMNRDLPEPFPTPYFAKKEEKERLAILANLIFNGRETSKKGYLLDEERISSGREKKKKATKFKTIPQNDKRIKEFTERYGTIEKAGNIYFEESDENLWDRYKKTLSDYPNLIQTQLTEPEKPLSAQNWNPGVAFAREMFNKAKFVEYTNEKGEKYLIALVMDTTNKRVVAIDVNELKKDMRKYKSRFTSWNKVLDTYTNRKNPNHSGSRHIRALVGWINYDYQGKFQSREIISGSQYGDERFEIPEKWVVTDAKVKAWHQGRGIAKELVEFHREVFPELNLGYKFKNEKEKLEYFERFDWWEGKDKEDAEQRKQSIRVRADSLGENITQEDVETRLRSGGGDSLETKQKKFRQSEKLAQARKLLQSIFNDTPVKGLIQVENKREEKMKSMLARGLQKIGIPNDWIWRIPGKTDDEAMDEVLSLLPEEERIVSAILESGNGIIEAIDDEISQLFEISQNGVIDEKTGKPNFDLVAARLQKLVELKDEMAAHTSRLDSLASDIPGLENLDETSYEVLLGVALGKNRTKEQSKIKSVPYAVDAKTFVKTLRDVLSIVNSSNSEAEKNNTLTNRRMRISDPRRIDDLAIGRTSIVNKVERNEQGIHKVEFVGKKLKNITRSQLAQDENDPSGFYEMRKPTEIVGTLTEEEKNLIEKNPNVVSDLLAILRESQLTAENIVRDFVSGDMDVDEKTEKQIPLLQLSDESILRSFEKYDMFWLAPYSSGDWSYVDERNWGKSYDFLTDDEKRNLKELREKIEAEKLLIEQGLPRTMSQEEYEKLVVAREQMLSSKVAIKFTPYLGEAEITSLPLGNGNGYAVSIKNFGDDIVIRKSGAWGTDRVDLVDLPPKYQNFIKDMEENLRAFLAISGEDRKKIFLSQVRKFFESEQVQSIERAVFNTNTKSDIVLADGSVIPAGTTLGAMRERTRAASRKIAAWEKELVELIVEHNEKISWDETTIRTLQDLSQLQNSLSTEEINQIWKEAGHEKIKSWAKTRILRLRQQKIIEALESVGVTFTNPEDIDKEFYDITNEPNRKSIASGTPSKVYKIWEIKNSKDSTVRTNVQLKGDLLYPLLDAQDRILRMIPKSLTDGSLSEQLSSVPDYIYSPYVTSQRKQVGEKRGVLRLISFLGFGRDSANHRANHGDFYDENGNIVSIISSARIPTLGGKLFKKDDTDIQNWERVQLHETVHGVETVNPWLGALQHIFWLSRRKKGEKLKKLSDIVTAKGGHGHYTDNEVALEDDWKFAYAGKKYGGPDLYERNETWEILTTGMERLFFGSRNLEVEDEIDRDHLNFVVGVLALSATKPGNSPIQIPKTERLSSGSLPSSSDEKRALKRLSSGRKNEIDENGRFVAIERQEDDKFKSRNFLLSQAYAFTDLSDEKIKEITTSDKGYYGFAKSEASQFRDFKLEVGTKREDYLENIEKYLKLDTTYYEESVPGLSSDTLLYQIATIRATQSNIEHLVDYFSENDSSPSLLSLIASQAVFDRVLPAFDNMIHGSARKKEYRREAEEAAVRLSKTAQHYISNFKNALQTGEAKEESFDELIRFFAKELKKLKKQQARKNTMATNTNILDNRLSFVEPVLRDLMSHREKVHRLNHPELPFNTSAENVDRAYVASSIFSGSLMGSWIHQSDSLGANIFRYIVGDSLTESIANSKPESLERQKTIKAAASLLDKFGFAEDAERGLVSVGAIRSIARAVYRSTQETLRRNGIRSIKLYRGSSNEELRQKLDSVPGDEMITDLRLRPISSWTFSDELAHGFYGNYIKYGQFEPEKENASRPDYKPYKPELQQKIFDNHVVYEADIPAEQVFSLPVFGAEDEVLVIGPTAKKAKVIRGDFTKRKHQPKVILPSERLSSGGKKTIERMKKAKIPDFAVRAILSEATKYNSPYEFYTAFTLKGMEGVYTHLTSDKNFKIDPRKTTFAGSNFTTEPGLFVSMSPEFWKSTFNEEISSTENITPKRKRQMKSQKAQYLAIITMANAPSGSYMNTNTGEGNQILLRPQALLNAEVHRVMPYKEGVRYFNRLRDRIYNVITDGDLVNGGNIKEELEGIWHYANTQSERLSSAQKAKVIRGDSTKRRQRRKRLSSERLSSGIELFPVGEVAEPPRTTQEKLDQGPKSLQFGRGSNGTPRVAELAELKKVYGNSVGQNRRYFANKYRNYNLKFNFKRPPVKGNPLDIHAYYGQLQAMDDVLSVLDESGAAAMLVDTEFIINQAGFSVRGVPVGALGSFVVEDNIVSPRGTMWLSWGFTRLGTEELIEQMRTEKGIGRTLEQIMKDANITIDSASKSTIATLGYPDGPNVKEDFARRMAYGITIHEFGHMLDSFGRKSLQAGPASLRESTTIPSRSSGTISGNDAEHMHSFVYSTLDPNFEKIPSITLYGSDDIMERTAEAFAAWWLFSGIPNGTLKIRPIDVAGPRRQTEEDISVIAKMILKPLFDSLGNVIKSDSAKNKKSSIFKTDVEEIPPLVKLFAILPWLDLKKEK